MTVSLILASQSPARRAVLAAAGVIPIIHVSEVDEPAALRDAASERGTSIEQLSAEQRVSILARAKAQAVYNAWKLVADAAASASGDLVVGYPLEAKSAELDKPAETAETESSESSESASNALASDSQSDVTHNVDTAQTRDFSGVTVPTKTFDIHDFAYKNKSSNDCSGVLIVGCDSMFLLDGECYGKPHTPEVAFERIKQMSGKTGQLWTGHCLIDAKTGKTVCKTSHASVTFAQMSDAEIRAYVATGEPLEVAGSFTLEGLAELSLKALMEIRTVFLESACRCLGRWLPSLDTLGRICGIRKAWKKLAKRTIRLPQRYLKKMCTSREMAGCIAIVVADTGVITVLQECCLLGEMPKLVA